MRKVVLFAALMLLGYMTAQADDLKYGGAFRETILELEFSEGAKANDAYISWDLVGDWDKFAYKFSQGEVKKGVYSINAGSYQDLFDQYDGVSLLLEGKSSTKSGKYVLSMIVKEVPKDMELTNARDDYDREIVINYTGIPMWRRLLVPFIILVVLILLAMLVLNSISKFPKGLLQVGTDTVKLKGKKMVSVKAELAKLNPNVQLGDGVDVVFVKKKFASFQGPCLKVASGCTLMRNGLRVTKGSVIRLGEEIEGLSDKDGNPIVIRYCY